MKIFFDTEQNKAKIHFVVIIFHSFKICLEGGAFLKNKTPLLSHGLLSIFFRMPNGQKIFYPLVSAACSIANICLLLCFPCLKISVGTAVYQSTFPRLVFFQGLQKQFPSVCLFSYDLSFIRIIIGISILFSIIIHGFIFCRSLRFCAFLSIPPYHCLILFFCLGVQYLCGLCCQAVFASPPTLSITSCGLSLWFYLCLVLTIVQAVLLALQRSKLR